LSEPHHEASMTIIDNMSDDYEVEYANEPEPE
jgi:hypothetical protein